MTTVPFNPVLHHIIYGQQYTTVQKAKEEDEEEDTIVYFSAVPLLHVIVTVSFFIHLVQIHDYHINDPISTTIPFYNTHSISN